MREHGYLYTCVSTHIYISNQYTEFQGEKAKAWTKRSMSESFIQLNRVNMHTLVWWHERPIWGTEAGHKLVYTLCER